MTYGEMRTRLEVVADERLRSRVLAGIEVLEREVGPDWVDKVDPAILCMRSATACILGQVYPESEWATGYDVGLRAINGEVERHPEEYGFFLEADDPWGWSELQEAWLVALGSDG